MKSLRDQPSTLVGGSSIHCRELTFSFPIVAKQRASLAYRKKPFRQQLRNQST